MGCKHMLLLPLLLFHTNTCVYNHTVGKQNSRKAHSLEGGEGFLKEQIISKNLKIRQKKKSSDGALGIG